MTALGLLGREWGRERKGRNTYVYCKHPLSPKTSLCLYSIRAFPVSTPPPQAANARHQPQQTLNSSCGNAASNFSNINTGNTNMI